MICNMIGGNTVKINRAAKTGQYTVITAGYTVTLTAPGKYYMFSCIERSNASTPTVYEPTITTGGTGVSVSSNYTNNVKCTVITKTGTSSGTVKINYSAPSGSYRWIIMVAVVGPDTVSIA